MSPLLQSKVNRPTGWLSTIFGSPRAVPGLDGLRAISVMLVIFSHLCTTRNFPLQDTGHSNFGVLGVRVFFVISGFLITSILLSDQRKNGDIDLKRFYFRRSLRLFPAAWVFITTAAVLDHLHFLKLERHDLLFAYTYTSNYYYGRSYVIGHLWSLAVEEQFYLLWPITLKLLGQARSRRFLVGLLIVAPLFRMVSPIAPQAFEFVKWSDALGTGCLLAILRNDLVADPRYRKLISSRWMAAAPFIVLLTENLIRSTKVSWLIGETIQNLGIALCVHWAILNSTTAVGKLLNLRIMSAVGVLSYSLYLWQQLFTRYGFQTVLGSFPLNVVMSFAAALLSYLLIEKPFLHLRERLEPRWWPTKKPATASESG